MLYTFTLDNLNHPDDGFLGGNDALDFPGELDVGHISSDLAWVHAQDNSIVVFSLELGSHVSDRHVEGRLGGSVCGEAIFHFAKVAVRARVAGHEDYGADGDVCL